MSEVATGDLNNLDIEELKDTKTLPKKSTRLPKGIAKTIAHVVLSAATALLPLGANALMNKGQDNQSVNTEEPAKPPPKYTGALDKTTLGQTTYSPDTSATMNRGRGGAVSSPELPRPQSDPLRAKPAK